MFHPAVASWLEKRFGEPTEPQRLAWPAIQAGRNTLIAAPTGSGKTLAAFLAAIDSLVRQAIDNGGLPDATQVVYVSPLKALSNDIQRNLQEPLEGILAELRAQGLPAPEIRTLVRTGDTPSKDRAAMVRRPPHILVTTPESLYILLTSEGGRGLLKTTRTLIVDEIHAVADDKRGSHLSLSIERLEALAGRKLVRVGLSATQRPIEEVARFLVGSSAVADDGAPDCVIVDTGHRRALDLAVELPRSPLEAVMAGEVWEEVYERLAELIREHRTTLVFVNTRKLAERVTRHLSDRLGEEAVASHHGSLSKEHRFDAEQRLKGGTLRALVATASLELGIDIGAVDLVCQIGSTRSIATLLQRVGRSGHSLGGLPKGRLFPLTLDELVETAALLDSVRRGELERLVIPEAPLDILAQQIVAAVACEEWSEEGLFDLVRRAYPYRALPRETFDAVVLMVSEGFSARRGRRGAFLHRDEVQGRLRPRRGARLSAITSGGAIPDTADYQVILEPSGTFLGTVNEDFAIESNAGDIFQLGNASWRIARVDQGRVLVEDAKGQPPSLPFWLGEAPGRSEELSRSVSRLRGETDTRLGVGPAAAVAWLADEVGVGRDAAAAIVEHLGTARLALGAMPTQETLVLERFFDEAGDQHLVIHAPFGSHLNRAWGLAIRKRMCRAFNFELQAAATEDAIVLSLGPTHSFAPIDLFGYLHSGTVREVLVQALLDAPVFPIRWRWNASRALAIPRFRGGRRVPPRLQRMQAEDLVATVFPDQLACLENIVGDREVPDHPLVAQTIHDCLFEAMDVGALEELLRGIERGDKTLVAADLTEPSPLAREVLTAKPYAFLDDAPLEERRTQAVISRRWLDAETAASLGTLDPDAIERVVAEAWPEAERADELQDAMVTLGFLTASEVARFPEAFVSELTAQRRSGTLAIPGGRSLAVAVERLPQLLAIHGEAVVSPALTVPARIAARTWEREEALREIVRARLETVGPTTARELAEDAAVPTGDVEIALAALEGEGFVLRGRYRPQAEEEWCERRLLSRIHRATLERLRREIEPVTKADYLRFLFEWQRVATDAKAKGAASLEAILDQLEGFEAPASAWESEILPARIERYEPAWLDALCLSGRFVWGRARGADTDGAHRSGPVRATPISLRRRESLAAWRRDAEPPADARLSAAARAVRDHLATRGASFFDEIVRGTGLLRTQVEEALGELVTHGLATSDSFTGLRALLTPSSRRPGRVDGRKRSLGIFGMENAGRWSLFAEAVSAAEEDTARIAATLLRRYGVVFRRLLEREAGAPPWRELIRVYRRLESRGEVRGGRFVDGVTGEQYALPEAVTRLRALRKKAGSGASIPVTAADPLNLLGIVLPGERVLTLAGNRVLYRDGIPVAVLESGKVRMLVPADPASEHEARGLLIRRPASPLVRSYLSRKS